MSGDVVTELLSEPPELHGYKRTNEIAKFLGRFDTEVVIAQRWESDHPGFRDLWVVIPTYLLSGSPSRIGANTYVRSDSKTPSPQERFDSYGG